MMTRLVSYEQAQHSTNLYDKQAYLDECIAGNKTIERIVCTTTNEAVAEYADVLIAMQYLAQENRGKMIKASEEALQDKPILIMARPKVIAAKFPLRIICTPQTFEAPTEGHFLNYMIDNYAFIASQIYEGFEIADGTWINSVSVQKFPDEKINHYLYFIGYRNQVRSFAKRRITDADYIRKYELELLNAAQTVMDDFPDHAYAVRKTITQKIKI